MGDTYGWGGTTTSVPSLWPPCIADVDIFLSCFFLFFYLAWSQRLQTGCLPYFHTWCGLSAKLECRSEMYCTWLAENTGHKTSSKKSSYRHHRTTLSGCITQLRHISTVGKNLLNNTSSTCPDNMVNLGPITAEIISLVWGTLANFNGFRVLAALLHGTPVISVSQTLRRLTGGTTYIRQRSHHVGHWPTFYTVSQKTSHLYNLP